MVSDPYHPVSVHRALVPYEEVQGVASAPVPLEEGGLGHDGVDGGVVPVMAELDHVDAHPPLGLDLVEEVWGVVWDVGRVQVTL